MPIEDVAPVKGIDRYRRLGRTVEMPEEELAFVTESTIAKVLEPEALNGGNLVDIYQKREEDFLAKNSMEFWYYDSDGAKVREMMYVLEPKPPSSPRVCITADAVRSMHRAISVLTRKVDNLNMTLRSCREHYYKELSFLRHGTANAGGFDDVYFFNPKAYEDHITKELVHKLVDEKVTKYTVLLEQQEAEIQRLTLLTQAGVETGEVKSDLSKLRTLLATLPLDQLFHILKTVNAPREAAFYEKVEKLLRERNRANSATPDSDIGRTSSGSGLGGFHFGSDTGAESALLAGHRMVDMERKVDELQGELRTEKAKRQMLEAQMQKAHPAAEATGSASSGRASRRIKKSKSGQQKVESDAEGPGTDASGGDAGVKRSKDLEATVAEQACTIDELTTENSSLKVQVSSLQGKLDAAAGSPSPAVGKGADPVSGQGKAQKRTKSASSRDMSPPARSPSRRGGAQVAQQEPKKPNRSTEPASPTELRSRGRSKEAERPAGGAPASQAPSPLEGAPSVEALFGAEERPSLVAGGGSARQLIDDFGGDGSRRRPTSKTRAGLHRGIAGLNSIRPSPSRADSEQEASGELSPGPVRHFALSSKSPLGSRHSSKSSQGRLVASMYSESPPPRLDTPGDDEVMASQSATAAEDAQAKEPSELLGAHGDGATSSEGARESPMLTARDALLGAEAFTFERWDLNGDGVISREEFDAVVGRQGPAFADGAEVISSPGSSPASPVPEVCASQTVNMSDGAGLPSARDPEPQICQCGTPFAEGSLFCWRCGRQRPGVTLEQLCADCGSAFGASEGFCQQCGKARGLLGIREGEEEEDKGEDKERRETGESEKLMAFLRGLPQRLSDSKNTRDSMALPETPDEASNPLAPSRAQALKEVAESLQALQPRGEQDEAAQARRVSDDFLPGTVMTNLHMSTLTSQEALDSPELVDLPPGSRVTAIAAGTGQDGRRLCVRTEDGEEGWVTLQTAGGQWIWQDAERAFAQVEPQEEPPAGVEADADRQGRAEEIVLRCAEFETLKLPEGARIVSAWFGSPDSADKRLDLAGLIQEQYRDGIRQVDASRDLYGDPCEGAEKVLEVTLLKVPSAEQTQAIEADALRELGASVSAPGAIGIPGSSFGFKGTPPTTAGSLSAPGLGGLGATRPSTGAESPSVSFTRPGTRASPWKRGDWRLLEHPEAGVAKEDKAVQTGISFDWTLPGWMLHEDTAEMKQELLQWCLRFIETTDPGLLVKQHVEPPDAEVVPEKPFSIQVQVQHRSKTPRTSQGASIGATNTAFNIDLPDKSAPPPAKKAPVLRNKNAGATSPTFDFFGDAPAAKSGPAPEFKPRSARTSQGGGGQLDLPQDDAPPGAASLSARDPVARPGSSQDRTNTRRVLHQTSRPSTQGGGRRGPRPFPQGGSGGQEHAGTPPQADGSRQEVFPLGPELRGSLKQHRHGTGRYADQASDSTSDAGVGTAAPSPSPPVSARAPPRHALLGGAARERELLAARAAEHSGRDGRYLTYSSEIDGSQADYSAEGTLEARLDALAGLRRPCAGTSLITRRSDPSPASSTFFGRTASPSVSDFDTDRDGYARRRQGGGSLQESMAAMRFGGLAQGNWNPATASGGVSSRNAATYLQGVEELLRADSDEELRRSRSPAAAPGSRSASPPRRGAASPTPRAGQASPAPRGGHGGGGQSARQHGADLRPPVADRPLDRLPFLRPAR